jgi:hypothetical protein
MSRTSKELQSVTNPAVHSIGQERELHLSRSYAEGLKVESEQSQVLIRELQERIQSDDRVSELEALLQNIQNRASELEFQLSKSKQVCHLFFSGGSEIHLLWGVGQYFTQGRT